MTQKIIRAKSFRDGESKKEFGWPEKIVAIASIIGPLISSLVAGVSAYIAYNTFMVVNVQQGEAISSLQNDNSSLNKIKEALRGSIYKQFLFLIDQQNKIEITKDKLIKKREELAEAQISLDAAERSLAESNDALKRSILDKNAAIGEVKIVRSIYDDAKLQLDKLKIQNKYLSYRKILNIFDLINGRPDHGMWIYRAFTYRNNFENNENLKNKIIIGVDNDGYGKGNKARLQGLEESDFAQPLQRGWGELFGVISYNNFTPLNPEYLGVGSFGEHFSYAEDVIFLFQQNKSNGPCPISRKYNRYFDFQMDVMPDPEDLYSSEICNAPIISEDVDIQHAIVRLISIKVMEDLLREKGINLGKNISMPDLNNYANQMRVFWHMEHHKNDESREATLTAKNLSISPSEGRWPSDEQVTLYEPDGWPSDSPLHQDALKNGYKIKRYITTGLQANPLSKDEINDVIHVADLIEKKSRDLSLYDERQYEFNQDDFDLTNLPRVCRWKDIFPDISNFNQKPIPYSPETIKTALGSIIRDIPPGTLERLSTDDRRRAKEMIEANQQRLEQEVTGMAHSGYTASAILSLMRRQRAMEACSSNIAVAIEEVENDLLSTLNGAP